MHRRHKGEIDLAGTGVRSQHDLDSETSQINETRRGKKLYVDRCNWINQNGMQCGQPLGHNEPHGNGSLTTPHDEWHKFIEEQPVRPKLQEPFGRVWIEKSVKGRCPWQGAYGRCIYETGHTISHREEALYRRTLIRTG